MVAEALGSGIDAHREPVATDAQALGQEAAVSSATAQSGMTTRVAPAAKASSICSGPSMPPATWSGRATMRATAPMTSTLAGRPRGAVEVDEVDDAGAPCSTSAAAMTAGRSVGAPCPLEAPGHQTRRDRPAWMSMLGMTSIATAADDGSGCEGRQAHLAERCAHGDEDPLDVVGSIAEVRQGADAAVAVRDAQDAATLQLRRGARPVLERSPARPLAELEEDEVGARARRVQPDDAGQSGKAVSQAARVA